MNKVTKLLGFSLIAAGLTACGAYGSEGPSFQVQELQQRNFTNIVVEEEGPAWGYYGVSVDGCRLRMTWTNGNGWAKFDGMTDEVTADTIRRRPEFQACLQGAPAPKDQPLAPPTTLSAS